MPDKFKVATSADEGLFALLVRSAQEASRENTPVGVLVIGEDASSELSVEAALSDEGGWRLRRIDVKMARELETDVGDDVLSDALEHFGGTAFTNLCLEQPGRELLDVTVAFPERFAFYARNSALVADELDSRELERTGRALDALGIAHRQSGRSLRVRKRQLRLPLRLEAQIAAFRAATRGEGGAELYCSELPPTRSLRLMQRRLPGSARHQFECVISRGMAKATLPLGEVTESLESFVKRRFGANFGAKSWAVENIHGERLAPRRVGVFDERKEIRWSVNWGHSRR